MHALTQYWQKWGFDQSPHKAIFAGVALLALLILPVMSWDAGINGDERFQVPYAEELLDFYFSGGSDRSFLDREGKPGQSTFRKGGLFEVTSGLISRTLGFHPDSLAYHKTRHLLVSLFAFMALLFTGLVAREIGGWRAGWLTLLFLFLTPRFLGHGIMNPKDIPFAAAYIMGGYFLIRYIKQFFSCSRLTIAGIILSIGMLMSIRAGGLILIAYLLLFTGILVFYHWRFTQKLRLTGPGVTRIVKRTLLIAAGGYAAGLIFWPYALLDPLRNPVEALLYVSNFHANISNLFFGQEIFSQDAPWYYIPGWFAITAPLHLLLTLGAFLLTMPLLRKDWDVRIIAAVLFLGIFPVCYVIYKESTLYDGMRQLLFILPPLVALTGAWWDWVLRKVKVRWAVIAVSTLLAALLYEPLAWTIRAHPIQYVYFNPVIGGIQGAYGQFETDYWMLGANQSAEWVRSKKEAGRELHVASDCSYPVKTVLGAPFHHDIYSKYVRYYDRNSKEWEYGIFFSRFVDKEQLDNGTWPPQRTVHTVEVDNIPLSIVLKNPDNYAYRGNQALNKKNYKQAAQLLQQATDGEKDNEQAWMGLGMAYLNIGQHNASLQALEQAIRIRPKYAFAHYLLGNVHLRTQQLNKAVQSFQQAIQASPKFIPPYLNLANIYIQNQKLSSAIYYLEESLQYRPTKKAYEMLAQIYQQQGQPDLARQYQQAANQIGGR